MLSYTALFDTIIALFLTSVEFGHGFVTNFIFSQCIGISICSCIMAALHLLKPTRPAAQLLIIMTAMTVGSIFGTLLGTVTAGIGVAGLHFDQYDHIIKTVVFGILFGSIITYVFISRERITATEALIQEERIKRLTSEKKLVETNLKILQAQIEPHFLFNTLSNILSLVDAEPEKGKHMLEDLIRYLRASLSKTRSNTSTIGQEMEMIRAYLNIFKVRMGDRLRYDIDVPDSVRNLPFPPMLVQPLVENALIHGLEPRVEGGRVSIGVAENGGFLRIEVADTGLGFHGGSEPGVGLSNIRERLQSLYGEAGRLILEENQPSGVKAVIEVPSAENQGNHS